MDRLNASSASLSLGMQLAAARLLFVWLGRWCGALARATRKKLQPAAEATSRSSSSSNLFIADERCFMARGARGINSLLGYFGNEPARSI